MPPSHPDPLSTPATPARPCIVTDPPTRMLSADSLDGMEPVPANRPHLRPLPPPAAPTASRHGWSPARSRGQAPTLLHPPLPATSARRRRERTNANHRHHQPDPPDTAGHR